MNITYRDAVPADAAALDRIFDSSFCDAFAHLYRPEDLEAFLSSFGVSDWEEQLNNRAYGFRLAEVAGEPVGYVKLGPMKLPSQVERPAILLDQIYILTGYHGVGIAHGLMDWAIDEARRRGAEELYLTVYIENHRARRFYDRYAFEDVGRYEFKVGNHVDEDVVMRKSL
jgi:ribosomal protein S18 acetylase RimI-like enzyme